MCENTLVVPGITDLSTLTCLARARSYKLYVLAVENAQEGRCAFCDLNTEVNKVIIQDPYWRSWQNPSAEDHTKHHFVIAPRRHISDTEELSDEEVLALFEMMRKLRALHGYQSRGVLIRDGDATLGAGTIQHLHVHVMVPDGTGRVESPFYKGPEGDLIGMKRASVFEKLRQGATPDELTQKEQDLVEGRL